MRRNWRCDAHLLNHVGVRRTAHVAVSTVVGDAVNRPLIAAHAFRVPVIGGAAREALRNVRLGAVAVNPGVILTNRMGLLPIEAIDDAARIELLPEDTALVSSRGASR